jgi:hypothetical protein
VSRRRAKRRTSEAEPEAAVTESVVPPAVAGRVWWVAVAIVVASAAALRILAARGDLWLDEVWTVALLDTLRSPVQIVTKLTHDNNHILNSLFVWILRGHDFAMRLPAVIAGTAGVAFGAWFSGMDDDSAPRDPSHPGVRALLAAVLLGASHLMVHYQSEARGYALAVGLGLVSPWAFLRARGAPGARLAMVHWAAVCLALLGHAVAIHLFVATVAWSLVRFRRDGMSPPAIVMAALWWHGVPATFAAALYFGFLSRLTIGGGPQVALPDVLGSVVAFAFGLPLSLGTGVLLLIGIALIVGALVIVYRTGSDQGAFYLTGIVLSPIAALAFQPGDLQFERYFIVSAAVALLLIARAVAVLTARAPAAAALVALVFVAGQAPRLHRLIRDGRGHYTEAIRYLVDHSPTRPVRLASDHDFRNPMVIAFYGSRLGLGPKDIAYVPSQQLAASGADWYLVHKGADEPAPPAVFTDGGGRTYRLEKEYPSAPLSGFRWLLFHKEVR